VSFARGLGDETKLVLRVRAGELFGEGSSSGAAPSADDRHVQVHREAGPHHGPRWRANFLARLGSRPAFTSRVWSGSCRTSAGTTRCRRS